MNDPLQERVFTVGELCDILRDTFRNPSFQGLLVIGEILKKTVRNGHVYLDLGDPEDTSLRRPTMKGILWESTARRLLFPFEVGDVVQLRGGLDFYPGNSSLSLIASTLFVVKSKEGKSLLNKRRLLEKLAKEGALDPSRKRPIPRFVNRLAIVSSSEAAGYRDILNALARRYPTREKPVLFPATVQGPSAPSSIATALREAYRSAPDAVILARGGGSKSDLSCFDDERVARAILASPCPVITAIGHQIDVSVADRVADLVAITPTDVANAINPSLQELEEELSSLRASFLGAFKQRLDEELLFLSQCEKRLLENAPGTRVRKMELMYKDWEASFHSFFQSLFYRKEANLSQAEKALGAFLVHDVALAQERYARYALLLSASSVRKALQRGFAYVVGKQGSITSVSGVSTGERVTVYLKDGRFDSDVASLVKKEE